MRKAELELLIVFDLYRAYKYPIMTSPFRKLTAKKHTRRAFSKGTTRLIGFDSERDWSRRPVSSDTNRTCALKDENRAQVHPSLPVLFLVFKKKKSETSLFTSRWLATLQRFGPRTGSARQTHEMKRKCVGLWTYLPRMERVLVQSLTMQLGGGPPVQKTRIVPIRPV